MAVPIEDVVAQNLVWFRKQRGVSQENLAHAVQELGLAWSRSTVAAIEGGSRRVSLGELLMLAHVLAPVAELLTPRDDDGEPTDAWVGLAPGLHVRGPSALLAGELAVADVRQRKLERPDVQPDLADRLAAEKLGISVDEVADRAYRLWGMTLTQKRDEVLAHRVRKSYVGTDLEDIAGDRPELMQALRGHITRELYKALDRAGSTKSKGPSKGPRRSS